MVSGGYLQRRKEMNRGPGISDENTKWKIMGIFHDGEDESQWFYVTYETCFHPKGSKFAFKWEQNVDNTGLQYKFSSADARKRVADLMKFGTSAVRYEVVRV